jgi:hypothetical protein
MLKKSDMTMDVQVKMDIDNEFQFIWSSLTNGLEGSQRRLKSLAKTYAFTMINQGLYDQPNFSRGSTPDLSPNVRSSMLFDYNQSNDPSRPMSVRMSKLGGLGLTNAMAMYGNKSHSRMSSANSLSSPLSKSIVQRQQSPAQ